MAACETCGATLRGRCDQRFCSPRCRMAAHRARRRAATPDWRLAAALLEANWPETWGEHTSRVQDDDMFREIDADVAALAE